MDTEFALPFDGRIEIPTSDDILDAPLNLKTKIIPFLTLEHYHEICSTYLGRYHHWSTVTPAALGALLSFSFELERWVEIASLPDPDIRYGTWHTIRGEVEGVTIDGWTRYFIYLVLPLCKFGLIVVNIEGLGPLACRVLSSTHRHIYPPQNFGSLRQTTSSPDLEPRQTMNIVVTVNPVRRCVQESLQAEQSLPISFGVHYRFQGPKPFLKVICSFAQRRISDQVNGQFDPTGLRTGPSIPPELSVLV
jgi:hypothetical protein